MADLRRTVTCVGLVSWSMQLAESLLADRADRWSHVRGVASRAVEVGSALPGVDGERLVAAAWLHDIGYADSVANTGLHALDGARHLRDLGADVEVIALVAHHSCAVAEAEQRGLVAVLDREFPFAPSELSDALWYCDMTVGPRGEPVDVQDRLEEIRRRYGSGHVVSRAVAAAEQELLAAVRRTEDRLALVAFSR